jgi:hypothetical protein
MTLLDVLIWAAPLAMLGFCLILAARARRGERGWTIPLRLLLAISVLAVLGLVVSFGVTLLTLDTRNR